MAQREQKRRQTRDEMVRVAFDLFRERGYDATTVEEIAEIAGVSPRTFYRYFTSKDVVVAERGLTVTEEVLRRLQHRGRDVRGLLACYAEVMEEQAAQDDFELLIRLMREHPRLHGHVGSWRQSWADRLTDGVAQIEGQGPPTLDHRLRSTLTVHLLQLALDEWLEHERNRPISEWTAALADATEQAVQGKP